VPSASSTFAEPLQQLARLEQTRSCCGQLDRERQSVESPADLDHRVDVVVGHCEVVAHGLRTIHEELHCRELGSLLDGEAVGGRRHR